MQGGNKAPADRPGNVPDAPGLGDNDAEQPYRRIDHREVEQVSLALWRLFSAMNERGSDNE